MTFSFPFYPTLLMTLKLMVLMMCCQVVSFRQSHCSTRIISNWTNSPRPYCSLEELFKKRRRSSSSSSSSSCEFQV